MLQVPPETDEENVVGVPTQSESVPVILPGLGNGFTVMNAVATAKPQALVTV
jgi:hypothetical protein